MEAPLRPSLRGGSLIIVRASLKEARHSYRMHYFHCSTFDIIMQVLATYRMDLRFAEPGFAAQGIAVP